VLTRNREMIDKLEESKCKKMLAWSETPEWNAIEPRFPRFISEQIFQRALFDAIDIISHMCKCLDDLLKKICLNIEIYKDKISLYWKREANDVCEIRIPTLNFDLNLTLNYNFNSFR